MTLDELRRYAVAHSLFPATDLVDAIRTLGYVQADPIRAPARAQDLILRHRVKDYRVDDLERHYPQLPLIEDTIYNYGFFHRETRALLHPRKLSAHATAFMQSHATLRRKVLRYLAANPAAHPREIESAVGDGARVNGWGGSSSAATMMLECLHKQGKLQVCRRDAGIKVYSLTDTERDATRPTSADRADRLIRLVVNLYAPMAEKSLMPIIRGMGRYRPDADFIRRFARLIQCGELRRESIDGIAYVWPADESIPDAIDDSVRFLAPFDPVVWDRARFEHLWGWAYRFEAYTPPPKRKLGYYALPLLWREHVIGWANASLASGKLDVQLGFASKRQLRGHTARFNSCLASETEAFRQFLLEPVRPAPSKPTASRP